MLKKYVIHKLLFICYALKIVKNLYTDFSNFWHMFNLHQVCQPNKENEIDYLDGIGLQMFAQSVNFPEEFFAH